VLSSRRTVPTATVMLSGTLPLAKSNTAKLAAFGDRVVEDVLLGVVAAEAAGGDVVDRGVLVDMSVVIEKLVDVSVVIGVDGVVVFVVAMVTASLATGSSSSRRLVPSSSNVVSLS